MRRTSDDGTIWTILRTSVRSEDMAELESRLREEMNEKVEAFEEQLRKMQQDYPQIADGFQDMQQQGEQVSAGERTELTLQLDEVRRVKIELQLQREQQERQMEQMKCNKSVRSRGEWSSSSVKWPRSENRRNLSLHRKSASRT